jgi:hypothetical protein
MKTGDTAAFAHKAAEPAHYFGVRENLSIAAVEE